MSAVRASERERRRVAALEAVVAFLPDAGDVDEIAWLRMRCAETRAAVDALPPPQRDAIALAFFEGLSYREIAQSTGVPLTTVKTRVRAGLLRLHRALAPV